jgi:hypothetical protein
MNDTLVEWWDGMDGDNLICSPGHPDVAGFALPCLIVTVLLPLGLFCFGVCFFVLAWRQRKLARGVLPRSGKSAVATKPQQQQQQQQQSPSSKTFALAARAKAWKLGSKKAAFALIFGVQACSLSLTLFINGHGTKYPSDTLPGILADLICKLLAFACLFVQHSTANNPVRIYLSIYLSIYGTTNSHKLAFAYCSQHSTHHTPQLDSHSIPARRTCFS